MNIVDATRQVLEEGPLTPAEIVVNLKERGYREDTDPRLLLWTLREAIKRTASRLLRATAGCGRWPNYCWALNSGLSRYPDLLYSPVRLSNVNGVSGRYTNLSGRMIQQHSTAAAQIIATHFVIERRHASPSFIAAPQMLEGSLKAAFYAWFIPQQGMIF